MKKDNSTLNRNLALRRRALALIGASDHVLETHGGWGRVGERLYMGHSGTVVEKDAKKSAHLSATRPRWRCYQADSEKVLRAGLCSDTPFALVDIDPYGSPFDVIDALFSSPRQWPESVQLVVNDGMRQKVKLGGAWHVGVLREAVDRRGNDLYPIYLDVVRELIATSVLRAGFSVAGWVGYYTGHGNNMTHYWANLVRRKN